MWYETVCVEIAYAHSSFLTLKLLEILRVNYRTLMMTAHIITYLVLLGMQMLSLSLSLSRVSESVNQSSKKAT